ncbi:hypothetical protein DM01DRAFT_1380643 [Hesseltinella vesiculosa]|uniref:SEC7 domain-containing protein n=1 Tax=Hesseltinella vesiculosa TaxID=101127 RepID=A0A1X2GRZ5_9FUNG|nr:hypothetical protein DM01DRAFT_1380643 [Hesseltinella vesiculosa]
MPSPAETPLDTESGDQHPTIVVNASKSQEKSDVKLSIPNVYTRSRSNSASSHMQTSPSFTQRLIDRGVNVPSFPSWEAKEQLASSSDIDSTKYYGLSPFVSTSFNQNGPLSQAGDLMETPFHHLSLAKSSSSLSPEAKFMSLRHRYERESSRSHRSLDIEDDEDDEDDDGLSATRPRHHRRHSSSMLHSHDDSDIELSDDDLDKQLPHSLQTSPMLWRTTTGKKKRESRPNISLPFNMSSSSAKKEDSPPPSSMDRFNQILAMKGYKPPSSTSSPPPANDSPVLPPHLSPPASVVAAPMPSISSSTSSYKPNPPRHHLLHTPVFEVINSNTVKDRYLFLFNDLLLICKPIMDENIIVGGGHLISSEKGSDNRYRFRPNKDSLFQVKNIVELSKLTLYVTPEDHQRLTGSVSPPATSMSSPPPISAPRKIHPVLTTALRKFEKHAEDGIQYLLERHILTKDPLSIANFLFKTPDLNRRELGCYLADRDHGDVYDAFLDSFRLVGLRLDEALRILLTTFRLPSKWELLEYVVERFAKKWHDANQNVVKFHEDMVVKVVVAMLFLNAEVWYDADSGRDVFWYARKIKEENDRQRLARRATTIDHRKTALPISTSLASSASTQAKTTTSPPPLASASATTSAAYPLSRASTSSPHTDYESASSSPFATSPSSPPSSAAAVPMMRASTVVGTPQHARQQQLHLDLHELRVQLQRSPSNARDSISAYGPLHYITALRQEKGSGIPTVHEYLTRWTQYDQYELVPREFMEDMYRSILAERLETGWDNKNGHHHLNDNGSSPDQEKIIAVTPHRLPNRLIKGVASSPITLSIPQPDPGLQIKLRGQDLQIEPNVLDFSQSATLSFTITGNTLGRTSLMFIKSGDNAGNYISPSLARTKTLVVERPFMRYTFQVAFSHTDIRAVKAAALQAAKAAARHKQQRWVTTPNRPVSIDDYVSLPADDQRHPRHPNHHHTKSNGSQSSSNIPTGSSSTSPTTSKPPADTLDPATKTALVKRRYLFSVETEKEKSAWLTQLENLCGSVVILGSETLSTKSARQVYRRLTNDLQSAEQRVALQVLKELLLADEVKRGTASVAMRTAAAAATTSSSSSSLVSPTSASTNKDTTDLSAPTSPAATDRHGASASREEDSNADNASNNRNSLISLSGGSANVVTKRGYEIIKLVVQNSMVPFMLGFLRSHIDP